MPQYASSLLDVYPLDTFAIFPTITLVLGYYHFNSCLFSLQFSVIVLFLKHFPLVVVENLFCIADQTGSGAQYYDGHKVTA